MSEPGRSAKSPEGEAQTGPTHIVTCFLLRRDRGSDELLLVRRSERVRTYRGRWAAISGYVESGVTPLQQAYVEVREETGLGESEVALLQEGEPLPVHDAAAALDWVVHPFLLLVKAPEHIRTDWEAQAMRWVAPDELAELETVPGLAAALVRVHPSETKHDDSATR